MEKVSRISLESKNRLRYTVVKRNKWILKNKMKGEEGEEESSLPIQKQLTKKILF